MICHCGWPTGQPDGDRPVGSVVCVGGCYGIASIYPIGQGIERKRQYCDHHNRGQELLSVLLAGKAKSVSDQVIRITRDGTAGLRGHINSLNRVLAALQSPVDRVIINGCNYLMMRGSQESQASGIKTMVSLNTLMIDGTGMCGVCRVTVGPATKFACVDGPHFDGHEVNWDELASRRQAYLVEEANRFDPVKPDR